MILSHPRYFESNVDEDGHLLQPTLPQQIRTREAQSCKRHHTKDMHHYTPFDDLAPVVKEQTMCDQLILQLISLATNIHLNFGRESIHLISILDCRMAAPKDHSGAAHYYGCIVDIPNNYK